MDLNGLATVDGRTILLLFSISLFRLAFVAFLAIPCDLLPYLENLSSGEVRNSEILCILHDSKSISDSS